MRPGFRAKSGFRHDQQVTDEQRLPGEFGDDAAFQAMGRISAGVEVLDEQRLEPGMGQ